MLVRRIRMTIDNVVFRILGYQRPAFSVRDVFGAGPAAPEEKIAGRPKKTDGPFLLDTF